MISPARRTASSEGHAPAATPRASTVSTEDAAWLFRRAPANAGSETKRSYVSSAQRTFSARGTSSAAAAASAAPNVRSVGATLGRSRSMSASAAFAAGRSRARAAAVITELYVRALGAHAGFPRAFMAAHIWRAARTSPLRAHASTKALYTPTSQASPRWATAMSRNRRAASRSPAFPAAETIPEYAKTSGATPRVSYSAKTPAAFAKSLARAHVVSAEAYMRAFGASAEAYRRARSVRGGLHAAHALKNLRWCGASARPTRRCASRARAGPASSSETHVSRFPLASALSKRPTIAPASATADETDSSSGSSRGL